MTNSKLQTSAKEIGKMAEFSALEMQATGRGPVEMGYLGSVVDVLAATLPDTLSNKTFQAGDYAYGFELASPRTKNSLGEALIVNGVCYATSSEKTSSDYHHTICGREFVTGGMFIIPQGAKPSHKGTFSTDESPMTLADFYADLYAALKQPLAFVGIGQLAGCHGTAIGKPPIDGRAIFEHKKEYFPHPEMDKKNVTAFVIGVITDYKAPELSEINKQLEVVLYKNPFDSDSGLSSHAHVLTLKQPLKSIKEIRPDLAGRALHLFTDGTSIRSLSVDIFTISSLVDYEHVHSGHMHSK